MFINTIEFTKTTVPRALPLLWKMLQLFICLFVRNSHTFLFVDFSKAFGDLRRQAAVAFLGCVFPSESLRFVPCPVRCQCGSPQGRVAPADWWRWQDVCTDRESVTFLGLFLLLRGYASQTAPTVAYVRGLCLWITGSCVKCVKVSKWVYN